MKINFILPGWPAPIGGFRVIYEYANRLVDLNHEVNIIHSLYMRQNPFPKNYFKKIKRIFGLLKKFLQPKQLNWMYINKKINMIYLINIKEELIPNADCIVATAWQTSNLINKFSLIKGRKFDFIQDFYPYMGRKRDIVKTWKHDHKKIVISDWLYQEVLKYAKSKRDVICIKNSVNKKLFFRDKKIKKKNKSVCLMYSKGTYKNAETAIKTLIKVKKKIDINASIFGKDKVDLPLPNWIKFMGQLSHEDLFKLYNKSDIFLSSSRMEGGAGPIGEAMMCECAVITNDTLGSRDFAVNNKTALVSDPNQSKLLEINLIKVLKNKKLKTMLVKNALVNLKKFSWKNSAQKFEKFLKLT